MASVFSKIIANEIPAYRVAENEAYLAFLDIQPLAMGHVLVIPKKEVDYIFELDQATYLGMMDFVRKVAKGLKEAVPCTKIGVAVVGLEVPHAHVHLIPLNQVADMDFNKEKLKPSQQELVALREKIAEAIQSLSD